MFTGFADERIDVGEVTLRVRHGGHGPVALLIHGHPRTGATWHRVAPLLVEAGFTVVCPDVTGYGTSTGRDPRPDHSQQSKRTVAADLAALMDRLGHQRFASIGHDRGCYVAHRMAVDYTDRVTCAAFLDGIPIAAALDRCTAEFAQAWYHWFYFAQPERPERAILADPDAWYGGTAARMGAGNYAEFRAATRDPATVRAMLEDYRAGLSVDQHDERADRAAGRLVVCPVLHLWSSQDDLTQLHGDTVAIWREWVEGTVTGQAIDSGHHMAEENPGAVAAALIELLHHGPA